MTPPKPGLELFALYRAPAVQRQVKHGHKLVESNIQSSFELQFINRVDSEHVNSYVQF